MSVTSLPIRRTLTVIIAVAALLLGFAAIRAASAWTAEAAPLVASPASAASIESKLADEQARSADLQDRLTRSPARPTSMAAALQAAQDRIAADATHAEQLAKDLTAANTKLKTLEASIKKAAAAAQARTVTVVQASTASGSSSTPARHDDDGGPAMTDVRRPLHLAVMIGASTARLCRQPGRGHGLPVERRPRDDAAAGARRGRGRATPRRPRSARGHDRAGGRRLRPSRRRLRRTDADAGATRRPPLTDLAGRVETISGAAQALPGSRQPAADQPERRPDRDSRPKTSATHRRLGGLTLTAPRTTEATASGSRAERWGRRCG